MSSSVNFYKHFDKSIQDISDINFALYNNKEVGVLFQKLFKHISKGLNSFPDNISQENLKRIQNILTEQVEEKLQTLYSRSREELTDEKIHTLQNELAGVKATIAIQRGILASIRALANPTRTGAPNAIAENHATYYSAVTSGRNTATATLFPHLIFSFSCVHHALKNDPEQAAALEEIDASTPCGMQYLTNLSVLDVLLNGHLPAIPEAYQAPLELFNENFGVNVPLNDEEKKKYFELMKSVQTLSEKETVQLQGYLTSVNPSVEPKLQEIYQEMTRFGSRLIHTNSTYVNFIFQSVNKVLDLQDQFDQLLLDLSDKLSMSTESVFKMLRGNPKNALMLLKSPQECPVLPGLDLLIKEHSNRLEVYLSRRNDIEKALPIVIDELAGHPDKWNSIAQFLLEAHPLIAGFEKEEPYIRQLCKLSDGKLKWLLKNKEEYQKANKEFGLSLNDFFFWCSEKRIGIFDMLVAQYSKDKQFKRILEQMKPIIKELPTDIASAEALEREILRLISSASYASEDTPEHILLSHIDIKKLDTVSAFSLWVYNFSRLPEEEKQAYVKFIESYKSHIAALDEKVAASNSRSSQKLYQEFMLHQITPINTLKNEIVDVLKKELQYSDLASDFLKKLFKNGVTSLSQKIEKKSSGLSLENAICALLNQKEFKNEKLDQLCDDILSRYRPMDHNDRFNSTKYMRLSLDLEVIKTLIRGYAARQDKPCFVEVTELADLLTVATERTDKPLDFLGACLPDSQNKVRKFLEIRNPQNNKTSWGILELYLPLGYVTLLAHETDNKKLFNELLTNRFGSISNSLKIIQSIQCQMNNINFNVASGAITHQTEEENAESQGFIKFEDCSIM